MVLKAPGRTSPCCGAPLRGVKQLKHALEGTQDFFSRCRGGRKVKEKEKKVKPLHKNNQGCACLCSAHRRAECFHCFECIVSFPHEDSQ